MIKNNGLRINYEVVADEAKIIYQNNFDHNNSMKVLPTGYMRILGIS